MVMYAFIYVHKYILYVYLKNRQMYYINILHTLVLDYSIKNVIHLWLFGNNTYTNGKHKTRMKKRMMKKEALTYFCISYTIDDNSPIFPNEINISEDKKSKTPGIDSCPTYNTQSQRMESQLHGGKIIDEEKDEKIENLLARLIEKDNEIWKLERELYVEKINIVI